MNQLNNDLKAAAEAVKRADEMPEGTQAQRLAKQAAQQAARRHFHELQQGTPAPVFTGSELGEIAVGQRRQSVKYADARLAQTK